MRLKQVEAYMKDRVWTRSCANCGEPLLPDNDIRQLRVYGKEQFSGNAIYMKGVMKRYWIWTTCPSCRYKNALWKLGISRSLVFGKDTGCDMCRRVPEDKVLFEINEVEAGFISVCPDCLSVLRPTTYNAFFKARTATEG